MNKTLRDTWVVGTSFVVSVLDVVVNLIVALVTGSAVMLAQALQGMSDLITASFLLYGVRASRRGGDETHNFGYGREVYFWVMVSAVFMFFGTGLLSVYFGFQQLTSPQPVEHAWLALIVLVIGLSTNGYAFSLSFKRISRHGDQHVAWWRRLVRSSMAETKATFIVDLLGTAAAIFGLLAIGLYLATGEAFYDGLGAIVVGVSMMLGALLLIYDLKGLIVGRSLPHKQSQRLVSSVEALEGVHKVLDLRTMYMGSNHLLAVIEVHLDDTLSTDDIEALSDQIKQTARYALPHDAVVQVEAETPDEELV